MRVVQDGDVVGATLGAGESVTLDRRDGLATLCLNSPANRNALGGRSGDDLVAALERLCSLRDVRVALIRAKGPMFCPGADLEWLRPLEDGAEQRIDELLLRLNPLLAQLRELPMIVVAAVHGAVAGGGLGLMNAADIVIASSETKFNLAYSRIGATPDLGATFYLPRLIGERRAMELMLLSDSFDAARARELGLVNFVAGQETFEAEVDHLVKRLLDGPSEAHASIKRMIYAPTVSDLALQHEAERRNLLAAVRSAELGEGVRAFVSKRAPHFNDAAKDVS